MFLELQPLHEAACRYRIARPRIASLLARACAAPVTVIVGPAGAGKTAALCSCVASPDVLYFQVGNGCRTFARFVRGLARTVAPIAPGAQVSFARAWERSLQSRSPAVALAHWLCEHLDDTDYPIVIDDLQKPPPI
jgi:ATP/maltotriose-dependent transcriptional regulator MalT